MKNRKKLKPGLRHLLIIIALVSIILALQAAYGMTNVIGTVTAKRAGSVKVEFKPHKTAGPKVGDRVEFMTIMEGFEVKAGYGEVIEAGSDFAWVKIQKKPAKLKMSAVIHATGELAIDVRLKAKYEALRQTKDPAIFKYILQYAEQGNGQAQFLVAYALKFGLGVAKNKNESARRFQLAAEQGYPEAQERLAKHYDYGWGMAEDDKEAAVWYRKAAEQGIGSAQNRLGEMYFFEYGVKRDDAEALKWFRKAAELGNSEGEYNLGFMYQDGLGGVRKDFSEAAKWYRKAALQGVADAQCSLGEMYFGGQGVEKNHQESLEWFLKAAEQGYDRAQYKLGLMYEYGRGVSQNKAEALKWYRKAAAQDYDEAQMALKRLGVQ